MTHPQSLAFTDPLAARFFSSEPRWPTDMGQLLDTPDSTPTVMLRRFANPDNTPTLTPDAMQYALRHPAHRRRQREHIGAQPGPVPVDLPLPLSALPPGGLRVRPLSPPDAAPLLILAASAAALMGAATACWLMLALELSRLL